MPSLTAYVLLGFPLPCMWGIYSQLFQQSSAGAPYLGRGVAPLSHSCTITATAVAYNNYKTKLFLNTVTQ